MSRSLAATLVVLVGVALAAGPTRAASRSYLKSICLDELPDLKLVQEIRIPLGCELIDCCPRCTGPPSALDWKVRVAGDALAAALLRFEGLPEGAPRSIEGNARPTEKGVVLEPGESRLAKLPVPEGRVPLASLALRFDPQAVARMREERGPGSGSGPAEVSIAIDQMLDGTVVNQFLLRVLLLSCDKPTSCDHVKLLNNRKADSAVFLLDAERTASCTSDGISRGAASSGVGNVRATQSCNDDVQVFSDGDAMWMDPSPAWTDECGDELPADLDEALAVPLNVWLVPDNLFFPNPAPQATAGVANANALYDQNKTGISFSAQTATLNAGVQTYATIAALCAGLDDVPGNLYVKGELNVYYGTLTVTGTSCGSNRNVIFVGPGGNLATLAHELGHAFSLFGENDTWGHTNKVPGFSEDNVMWGGGKQTRSHLSLGQAFRFNVDPSSRLNQNGDRSGPTHPCPARPAPSGTPDPRCPPLKLDWPGHGAGP